MRIIIHYFLRKLLFVIKYNKFVTKELRKNQIYFFIVKYIIIYFNFQFIHKPTEKLRFNLNISKFVDINVLCRPKIHLDICGKENALTIAILIKFGVKFDYMSRQTIINIARILQESTKSVFFFIFSEHS